LILGNSFFLKKLLKLHSYVVRGDIGMIIAELSITPLGEGTSVGKYVKIALQVLKESRVKFETHAMATVVECESLEKLFEVVKKAHYSVLEAGAKRVITTLKIDDRRDKEATIDSKLDSIKV